jgi:general secretion pathway protein C
MPGSLDIRYIAAAALLAACGIWAYQLHQLDQVGDRETTLLYGLKKRGQETEAAQVASLPSFKELAGLNLFGDPGKPEGNDKTEEPRDVVSSALPTTRLNVKLVGILDNTDNNKDSALIESGGTAKRYYIGENIAGGASLYSVQADSVVLKRNGSLEVLRYPKVDPSKNRSSATEGGSGPSGHIRSLKDRIGNKI